MPGGTVESGGGSGGRSNGDGRRIRSDGDPEPRGSLQSGAGGGPPWTRRGGSAVGDRGGPARRGERRRVQWGLEPGGARLSRALPFEFPGGATPSLTGPAPPRSQ